MGGPCTPLSLRGYGPPHNFDQAKAPPTLKKPIRRPGHARWGKGKVKVQVVVRLKDSTA
jgi:hypothetical protein